MHLFEWRSPVKLKFVRLLLLVALVVAAGAYYYVHARPTTLILTGIVTTNDTIVSAQVAGRIGQLLVKEGDVVKPDQLLAVTTPQSPTSGTFHPGKEADQRMAQIKRNVGPGR